MENVKNTDEEEQCNICFNSLTDIIMENEFNYLLKCSTCQFKSCNVCIHKALKINNRCPHCQTKESYDIDYNDPIVFQNEFVTQAHIINNNIMIKRNLRKQLGILLNELQTISTIKTELESSISINILQENFGIEKKTLYEDTNNLVIDRLVKRNSKILNTQTNRYVQMNGSMGKKVIKRISQQNNLPLINNIQQYITGLHTRIDNIRQELSNY
jgi:hypothetical protein